MRTVATYIIVMLNAHFVQLFVQLFVASHEASFVCAGTYKEVVYLVVDVLVVVETPAR